MFFDLPSEGKLTKISPASTIINEDNNNLASEFDRKLNLVDDDDIDVEPQPEPNEIVPLVSYEKSICKKVGPKAGHNSFNQLKREPCLNNFNQATLDQSLDFMSAPGRPCTWSSELVNIYEQTQTQNLIKQASSGVDMITEQTQKKQRPLHETESSSLTPVLQQKQTKMTYNNTDCMSGIDLKKQQKLNDFFKSTKSDQYESIGIVSQKKQNQNQTNKLDTKVCNVKMNTSMSSLLKYSSTMY